MTVVKCQRPARYNEEITSADCKTCTYYAASGETVKAKKLRLINRLSPGDIVVMTAAIECLHRAYPEQYITDVDTPCNAIFEHNSFVKRLVGDPEAIDIEMHYDKFDGQDLERGVNRSGNVPVHFMEGYLQYLSKSISLPLPLITNRPHLYLSEEEKGWINQVEEITQKKTKFWLINSGTKADFTAKGWGQHNYQKVVDHFQGKVLFVQIGEVGHLHKPLNNVLSLVGKTDLRQLIRLAHHCEGGLGSSTLLQHLCAAWEKPYVCLLGGRESVHWVQYAKQTTLHTIGQLQCCAKEGCWKSRTLPLGDGSEQDKNLCEQPVLGRGEPIPRCMDLIDPEQVISTIERFYKGGGLSYESA